MHWAVSSIKGFVLHWDNLGILLVLASLSFWLMFAARMVFVQESAQGDNCYFFIQGIKLEFLSAELITDLMRYCSNVMSTISW